MDDTFAASNGNQQAAACADRIIAAPAGESFLVAPPRQPQPRNITKQPQPTLVCSTATNHNGDVKKKSAALYNLDPPYLNVGARVWCRCKTNDFFYWATIVAHNGRNGGRPTKYHVIFDDLDQDENVHRRVRLYLHSFCLVVTVGCDGCIDAYRQTALVFLTLF
jgi:hypothetical protein